MVVYNDILVYDKVGGPRRRMFTLASYFLHPAKYFNILLSPWRRFLVCLQGISCGEGCVVLGHPYIDIHDGSIDLGKRVRLVSSQANHEIALPNPVVLTARKGGVLRIGDDSVVNGATIRAYQQVIIGCHVWITAGCYVMDAHGHSLDAKERIANVDELGKVAPVVIEDYVWLGIGVKVLPGVTIGEGAVVGAGSVVTQDIPPYTLAAGVPARVIRAIKKCSDKDACENI